MKQISKETVYKSALESFGVVPPMIKEIAAFSVPVAALYVDGVITMKASAFSEMESNAIELRISSLNGCASCVKGHTYLSKKAGLNDDDIRAVIEGKRTSISSLNRIIRGVEAVYYASKEGFSNYVEILKYEFSHQEIFEIIGFLSLKTVSNTINNYLKAIKLQENISA